MFGEQLTFVVHIRSMEDNINSVLSAKFHRVTGTCMSTEPFAMSMRLLNAGSRFFFRKVAVLCGSGLRDLTTGG